MLPTCGVPESRKLEARATRPAKHGAWSLLGVEEHRSRRDGESTPQSVIWRRRLDSSSCVFKGAGKRDGEWVVAVPMCSTNQQTWSEVYDARLSDPEIVRVPQAASS